MASHRPCQATILLLLLLAAAAAGSAGQQPIPRAGCPDKCGDVSITFPFGTEPGCFLPGFEVNCNTSFTPPRAFLAYNNETGSAQVQAYMLNGRGRPLNYSVPPVELMDVSVSKSQARAYGAVTSLCFTSLDSSIYKVQSTRLAAAFRLSTASNVIVGVGWNADVLAGETMAPPYTDFKTACSQHNYCQANMSEATASLSWFGARIVIPSGGNPRWQTNPCSYSMLVDRVWYNFSADDTTGYEVLPKRYPRGVPFVFDFAVRNASLCPMEGQPPPPGFACVSGNSSCANATTGEGYICKCWDHYDGNPYIPNGCQDINQCEHPDVYPCSPQGICKNRLQGYDCPCKPGMKGDGKAGTCTDIFPKAAKVVLGAGLAVFSIVVACLLALVRRQQRRLDELFKRNGGEILKNVKSLTIYTKDQLKKYTENYSEFLGEGKFGKVYKGSLPDSTKVAVKQFIEVDEKTVGDFAKEVEIQANMIHTNILKLLGCCLEVDVPMLVYAFAANGNLENFLHGNRHKLSLNSRLDIAIGAAEGLKYMHSNAAKPIRHGDVKPDNILLDDKLVPKISDFGLSKLLNQEVYYATNVIGAMGYIDPVFMRTGKESVKNDVYSFGVVLLELITRMKIVYGENRSLITEFRKVCENEKSGRAMFDKEIETEGNTVILEEIGKLALECLKDDDEDRPDMGEVEERLKMLRRKRRPEKRQNASSQDVEVIFMMDESDPDITEARKGISELPLLPKRK